EPVVAFLRFIGPELAQLRPVDAADNSIAEKCARLDIADAKVVPLEWMTVTVSKDWKHSDEFWKHVANLLDAFAKAPNPELAAATGYVAEQKVESAYAPGLTEKLEKIGAGELPIEDLLCAITVIDLQAPRTKDAGGI